MPQSRPPPQKVGDQGQTEGLALLRMELGAGHVVAADDGGQTLPVVDGGQQRLGGGGLEVIGVDEIGVQSVRAVGDALE